jgi:O-antigen/teichoic acid export membrane protein
MIDLSLDVPAAGAGAGVDPELLTPDNAEDSNPGDVRTLARDGFLNLVGVALYGICNFALVVIITRKLGATGAGAFLEAVALFSILTKASLLGADLGLLRFIARFRALDRNHDVRRTLAIAIIPVALVSTVAGLAMFLLANRLGGLLSAGSGREVLSTYLRVMAPFVPIGAVYQALEGGSRGFGTMLPGLTIERIARPLLTPALVWIVLSSGLGATAIALAWAGPVALALLPMVWWTLVLVRRIERGSRQLAVSDAVDSTAASPATAATTPRGLSREFWRFSSPRALGGVFQIGIIWLDSLLIGALGSTRQAGIYAATTRWLIVGTFAGQAITMAFGPQISFVLARADVGRAGKLYQTATVWLMALAFPAYITTMVFAPLLLGVFGRGFGSGATSLIILGAANLFAAACGPVDVVLLMAGRSGLSLVNNGIALSANVGLNLLLIPRYGINGAAIAWAASLFITNAFPLVQVWRSPGVHPFGRGWATILGLSVACVAGVQVVVRLLLGSTLTALVVAIVATAALYGFALHRYRDALDVRALTDGWRTRRAARSADVQHVILTPDPSGGH